MFICFSLPIIVCIPIYFAFQVNKCSATKGFLTLTEFGETYIYQYFICLIFLENIVPVVSLILLNTTFLVRLKTVKNGLRSNGNEAGFNSVKITTTKLIIFLTFICIVTRAFDLTVVITNRLRFSSFFSPTDEMVAAIKLLRSISYFLLVAAHALEGILYYCYDQVCICSLMESWMLRISANVSVI